MVERVSKNEVRARLFAGWTIQSYELLSLYRFFGKLSGIETALALPDWLGGAYILIFTVAVFLGSALCWRFSDARRWVSGVVILLAITSVVDNLASGISVEEAKLPKMRLEAVHKSDHYLRILAARDTAQLDLEVLLHRTAEIPPTYTTQYLANENSKTGARTAIGNLDRQLQELDQQVLTSSGPELPGSPAEGALLGGRSEVWFSVVLTFALEALALSLTNIWRGQKPSFTIGPLQRLWTKTFRRAPKEIRPDHLAYLLSAVELGKDEVLAGYRAVAKSLGLRESHARRLMEECMRRGYIRQRRLRISIPATRNQRTPR